jgi:polysaccharide biosynthesis protein PelD
VYEPFQASQGGTHRAPDGQVAPEASTDARKPSSSTFGSDSMSAALGDAPSSQHSDSELASLTRRRSLPGGWTHLAWYKRPFIMAWVFIVVMWGYVARLGVGLRWAVGKWLRSRPGTLVRSAEVLLWPLFFIFISWVSNPANPFYINEGFPWPWIGVWLIALRYGALAGSVAVLVLLAVWYVMAPGAGTASLPRLYFLGGAIVTMVAGEFGSLWGARMARFREATLYLDDKIERLTRRLYLLKLSHDELEYELVDRPGTLRDALIELRGKLTPETTANDKLPGSRAMLQFLAQFCQIEAGAIYEFIDGPRPLLQLRADIGNPDAPDIRDPMVQRAVETGQSVHLQEHLVDNSRKSALLLVAPITDAKDNTIGLLTVNRMPFMSLNPDNLRNIWVLLQSYTEYLRLSKLALPYTDRWPDSPLELRHEFAWLQRLNIELGLQSWCVVWRCNDPQASLVLEQVRQEHASGEMCWMLHHRNALTLVSLLPFVGIAKVKVQQLRIEKALARSFGAELAQSTLQVVDIPLGQDGAWNTLRERVEEQT